MPNICTAYYVIEGEKKELDALYETMTSLQAMEQPLVAYSSPPSRNPNPKISTNLLYILIRNSAYLSTNFPPSKKKA